MSWNSPRQVVFPPWVDKFIKGLALIAVIGGGYVSMLVAFGASPKTTDVGYMPEQPIPYSHALHVGQLGLDCRYCHTTVEDTARANVPSTNMCMNCHAQVLTESPLLAPLRKSAETGLPVPWVRVHDLPEFAYFDHSAHVSRGVGCESCHGRVDTMVEVQQVETLAMAWCLDCHRNPEVHLRPPEFATAMGWQPPQVLDGTMDRFTYGKQFAERHAINPPTDCSTCHR